jgi:putative transposase
VLPKEAWLEHRGVAGKWPCWGFPSRIHLDNAKEFHGEMLRRACEQYGIALDYRRPRRRTWADTSNGSWGPSCAHCTSCRVRRSPTQSSAGTTTPKQSAVLTLDELERWLTDYIVCVYHAKRHRALIPRRSTVGPPASLAMNAHPLSDVESLWPHSVG